MATSANLRVQPWAWKDLYLAALMEADHAKMPARIASAERMLVDRARELFMATGDNVHEEEAMDDALYALQALKSCLQLRDGLEEAA